MTPRKALTVVFFVLVLGIGYYSMSAAPVLSDQNYSYHGGTEWHTDYERAAQIAADEDKPVLVYFWTTWCTYCEDYNQQVYPDPTVQSHLDEFVLVAVNLDADGESTARLKQRYGAKYPPQHVAVTADGTQLSRINGYADREDFVAFLERARTTYENQN